MCMVDYPFPPLFSAKLFHLFFQTRIQLCSLPLSSISTKCYSMSPHKAPFIPLLPYSQAWTDPPHRGHFLPPPKPQTLLRIEVADYCSPPPLLVRETARFRVYRVYLSTRDSFLNPFSRAIPFWNIHPNPISSYAFLFTCRLGTLPALSGGRPYRNSFSSSSIPPPGGRNYSRTHPQHPPFPTATVTYFLNEDLRRNRMFRESSITPPRWCAPAVHFNCCRRSSTFCNELVHLPIH